MIGNLKQAVTAAFLLAAGQAGAADLALVLSGGTEGPGGGALAEAARGLSGDLRQRGFTVLEARGPELDPMRAQAGELRRLALREPDADRIVIVLNGVTLSTTHEGWFLSGPVRPGLDALGIGAQALPLSGLLDLAGLAPGQAVVLLGAAPMPRIYLEGLHPGAGAVEPPQGVTVLSGPMGHLRRVLRDRLLDEGMTLDAALEGLAPGIEVRGFRSAAVRFGQGALPAPREAEERAYWRAVEDLALAEGYDAYLRRYPQGLFAQAARGALREIAEAPLRAAEAAEAALGLGREARRRVQRELSLLGFDPRGIDGLFGPGSRAAISAWQRSRQHEPSGYLDAAQVAELQAQARARAAELEREAEARRLEEERADRRFWQETRRDEVGLQRYLRQYPDGLFADEARRALAQLRDRQRQQAAAQERVFWDEARGIDTADAYREFLARHPDGVFAAEARERLDALTEEARNRDRVERLRAQEAQLVPTPEMRRAVEDFLVAQNQNPGPADGNFTRETRTALRRFQRSRGLEPTGYVDQKTFVFMMVMDRLNR